MSDRYTATSARQTELYPAVAKTGNLSSLPEHYTQLQSKMWYTQQPISCQLILCIFLHLGFESHSKRKKGLHAKKYATA